MCIFFILTYKAHVWPRIVLFDFVCCMSSLWQAEWGQWQCTECTTKKNNCWFIYFSIKSHQSQYIGLAHGILMYHFYMCFYVFFPFFFLVHHDQFVGHLKCIIIYCLHFIASMSSHTLCSVSKSFYNIILIVTPLKVNVSSSLHCH